MTDPRNPLTPRVIVNRLWHHHFGTGIVDTPSDFGFSGGRPQHPELLDWLARRLIDGGWKLKDIHRLIVSSSAWKQTSNVRNPEAEAKDAGNRLLWKYSSRRLDGEVIRDSMLAVSGVLNRAMGGPAYRDISVNGGAMGTNAEFTEPTGEFSPNTCRRTIYRLWARSGTLPLLESLDCADPSVAAPRRIQTVTPLQSLSLLNGSFVEQCAGHLAEQVISETRAVANPEDERLRDLQVKVLFQRILGRQPDRDELRDTRQLVTQIGLNHLAIVLMNTNEFLLLE